VAGHRLYSCLLSAFSEEGLGNADKEAKIASIHPHPYLVTIYDSVLSLFEFMCITDMYGRCTLLSTSYKILSNILLSRLISICRRNYWGPPMRLSK
jgi:hypothetical protein